MSKSISKKKTIYDKYKSANITRFVFETIFIISAMFLYASMVLKNYTLYQAGPLFLLLTAISLILSVIYEIKRLSISEKIKKKEQKKLENKSVVEINA